MITAGNGRPPARVAIVATGVIGRSWTRVFTRAGCEVRAWDPDQRTLEAAMAWHDEERRRETPKPNEASRLIPCATLAEALEGAEYVQESGPESLEVKHAIYTELDRLAPPAAILASSTSALDMSEIARGLAGEGRCVVAHPVNPPHAVPVVEVLGGLGTEAAQVDATVAIMRAVGQSPIVLNYFVPGFVINRLQAALVREAIDLLRRGVADAGAIDAAIRDGLGLRWALLGPFGVANTNADGGGRDYFSRYGSSFERLMRDLGPTPAFDAELVEQLGSATDSVENGAPLEEIRRWRDRMVRKLVELKREDPHP